MAMAEVDVTELTQVRKDHDVPDVPHDENIEIQVDDTDGLMSKIGLSKKKVPDVTEQLARMGLGLAGNFIPSKPTYEDYQPCSTDTTYHSHVAPTGTSIPSMTSALPNPTAISKYEYNFTHKHRGIAHVFVNIDFDPATHQPTRTGAGMDLVNFNDIFTWLGFKVKRHQNSTVLEMQQEIQTYCAERHADDDCVAFAFSSHGSQDKLKGKLSSDIIYGTDGMISIAAITEMLTESNCPDMANKPKLFFFQACRGDDLAETIEVSANGTANLLSLPKDNASMMQPVEIPLHKDFFLACSAPPGFYSWRRAKGLRCGSWFVTAMRDVTKEMDRPIDLIDLMTRVSNRMSTGDKPEFLSNTSNTPYYHKRMINPWVASMLIKSVIFAPKPQ